MDASPLEPYPSSDGSDPFPPGFGRSEVVRGLVLPMDASPLEPYPPGDGSDPFPPGFGQGDALASFPPPPQSRPCPWVSHYKLYNGLDCILGSRPTHIRLYAPADRRRIDMRPNPI